jgi:hypothetical protein
MNYSYVFVLSMPRSGSTLFRMLLGNIEGCVSLPETFFFVFLKKHKSLDISVEENRKKIIKNWVNYYTVRGMINDLAALEQELLNNVVTAKDLLDITVSTYIKENNIKNVTYIIEKSPPHIFFQDDVKRMFPNSKCIYLIRDPRAVAGSMLNKTWSTHNIYTIARSWRQSSRKINDITPSIVVRYEDLVNKSKDAYIAIRDYLSSHVSEDEFYNSSKDIDFKGVRKDYHTNLNTPISSKHIEKWKSQLSFVDREQLIIEHVCKKEMQTYGYTLEKSKKDLVFYLFLGIDILKFIVVKFDKRFS